MNNGTAKRDVVIGGVPEHFNVPWHMALRDGALPALPVQPTWRDFPGGTGAMCRALARGDLDVAVLLTEGIVKHIDGGGAARIVGTYTRTPLVWGVHVAAGGPIASMDDLRGATYAISREGSGSHLMAQLDAAQRGWPEPSYEVVGDLDGGIAALTDGRADAFMWEKTMTLPFVYSGTFRRVGEFAGPWPAFAIAASERALEAGLDWLQPLLAHVRSCCDQADANRDATVAFIGDSYAIPTRDILAWLDATRWSCEPTASAEMLDDVVRILADAGILDERPSAAALVASAAFLSS